MRLIFLSTLLSLLFSTAFAQSETEAKFVLRDLQQWLPGEYDNDAQIFVESAFGAGDEGNHPWVHLNIEPVADSALGNAVFRVTRMHRGGSDQAPGVSLLAFSIDADARAVRMNEFDASGEPTGADPILWRQGPGHVYGAVAASVGKTRELRLTNEEFWDFDGTRKDEIPMRFTKVRYYECFALVHHADGEGMTIKNPFTMNDGGGVYTFETEEASPRTIEVLLRRSMWTSRSGNNFVPLLQISLFDDGRRESPMANAWSAAESGRVGFAARGLASGRCKLAAEGV